MKIYYDNYCPNCTLFVRNIKRLDWMNMMEIKELRNPNHISEAVGINKTLAEQQMASYNKKWRYGFVTIYMILLRLPLFWIFFPILFLFKITGLGQLIYKELAVKRKIIPIHCDEKSCKIP
ncbi:DCC1-like thiol-disulfide oxidoreductase family protein [Chryseobacterium sp. GVT01B]|uniref:DCC1-like thiol-disulfide oxidoreductase family protein n=1 Tax=Chryseobacterium sp. GVT01B TaxID=2862675 RepID=UPI001CBB2EDA|nr:DCC1-like thiol-disulfide oxidoreductase family protein [Chryseobacterium sp. GVT01B]